MREPDEWGPGRPFFDLATPLSLGTWQAEKEEFSMTRPGAFENEAESVLQSAQYRAKGTSFKAEMGDLTIDESPGTVSQLSRRGARFSLAGTSPAAAAELKSFAFTSGRPGDNRSRVVGAVGNVSLLQKAQFKTVYLSAKEALDLRRWGSDAATRGDVLGFIASVDPYSGKLVLETELDIAVFDEDSGDEIAPVGDKAYRARMGGTAAGYRYSAQYERTGPQYRILSGRQPRRDWEGYALALGKDFGVHVLDLRLSRHNDNVERSSLVPILYRYEGTLDYSCKKLKSLPLGLQYKKRRVQNGRLPEGWSGSASDEDTFTGRLNYLAGQWDLGVRAIYSQRTDLMRDERDLTATTVGVAPKYTVGALTVAPDLSLKRSSHPLEGQRTDEYRAGLDISGNALGELDYQLSGGFRKVLTDPPAVKSKALGANVRLAYPLKRLFRSVASSKVGVRGEYNGASDPLRRDDGYTVLFVIEGG